jgi:hypothetical protein
VDGIFLKIDQNSNFKSQNFYDNMPQTKFQFMYSLSLSHHVRICSYLQNGIFHGQNVYKTVFADSFLCFGSLYARDLYLRNAEQSDLHLTKASLDNKFCQQNCLSQRWKDGISQQ